MLFRSQFRERAGLSGEGGDLLGAETPAPGPNPPRPPAPGSPKALKGPRLFSVGTAILLEGPFRGSAGAQPGSPQPQRSLRPPPPTSLWPRRVRGRGPFLTRTSVPQTFSPCGLASLLNFPSDCIGNLFLKTSSSPETLCQEDPDPAKLVQPLLSSPRAVLHPQEIE